MFQGFTVKIQRLNLRFLGSLQPRRLYLKIFITGLICHTFGLFISHEGLIAASEVGFLGLIIILGGLSIFSLMGVPLWFSLHLISSKFKGNIFERLMAGFVLVNLYYIFESYVECVLTSFWYDPIVFFSGPLPAFAISFYFLWLLIPAYIRPIEEK